MSRDTDRQYVEALARGMSILEALSRAQRPLSNGEIAVATGLAPSTVTRLTHTLTHLGYTRVAQERRGYELTLKNLALGYQVLEGLALIKRTRSTLRQLTDETGETSALAILDGLHITFVDVCQGSNPAAVRLATGGRMPTAVSAGGIAQIAAMDERERRVLVSQARSYLRQRDGNIQAFNDSLAEAMETGIAIVRGEWRTGISGLAIALEIDGDTAAISIAVATDSVSEATMRGALTHTLREAAQRLA
ncbi:MAG: IclR family transcriptional regulator [Pararhodobacter sp.]|nr:IclR family transcriptional regulator [Pararhodobacter sp.]